jgi:hypothetical protein
MQGGEGGNVMDKGPWEVAPSNDRINSDDFTHDASLILYGDFAPENRRPYLQFIADELNSCASFRAKLDREKLASEFIYKHTVSYLHPDKTRSLRWDELTEEQRGPYYQDADAIIKYFEEG